MLKLLQATEHDEIPIQEIGGELKPNMKKVFFPAEIRRYVHVSRGAIIRNTKDGKNHPTILVLDQDGKKYAYHAVVLRGPSALKYSLTEPGVDANVFLVTKAGIEAYTDPDGDPPIVGEEGEPNLAVRPRFLNKLLQFSRRAFLSVWRAFKVRSRCIMFSF